MTAAKTIDPAQLWNHQIKAVEFAEDALTKYGGTLLAMEMGTGKTRCALEIASKNNIYQNSVSMLVICPNNVISVWENEADSYLPEYRMWSRRDAKGSLKKAAMSLSEFMDADTDGISIAVVNYEAVSSSDDFADALAEYEWDIMVADESHRLKNPQSKRAKAAKIIRDNSGYALGLTGTPRPNNQMDIWHQMSIFTPDVLPAVSGSKFSEWLNMNSKVQCVPRKGETHEDALQFGYIVTGKGYQIGDHIDVIVEPDEEEDETWTDHVELLLSDGFDEWVAKSVKGECECATADIPHLDSAEERSAWFRSRVADVMHTIKAKDVLDLPEHTVTQFTYTSSDSVAAAYEQMITKMEVSTKQGRRAAKYHIALPSHLQRILCGIMEEEERTAVIDGKVVSVDTRTRKEREFSTDPDHEVRKAMLASWMDDNSQEEKLVVYCHHQACMDAAHEVAAERGGSAEMSGRRKDIDELWRKGDARVAVISINAGAEGISLTEARCGIFFCHNWSAEKKPQAIARLVRPGQKYPVSIVEIEAHVPGRDMAMDQIILGRVAAKIEDSEKWLAGDFSKPSSDAK